MANEILKSGLKIAPLTGDIWDVYSGGNKIFNPNSKWQQRLLGAGQMGLGLAGLATLGAGSLAKSGVKGLAEYAGKYGAKKAINKTAQKEAIKAGANPLATSIKANVSNIPYNAAILANKLNKNIIERAGNINNSLIGKVGTFANSHPIAIPGLIEGLNLRIGYGPDDNNNNQQQPPQDVTQMGNGDNQLVTPQSNIVRTGSGVPIGRYYNSGVSGTINPQSINQAINNTNTTVQQPDSVENNVQYSGIDPGEIYRRYLDKQEALEPYRRSLNNYVRDYHRLSDLSYNQDKYLALLAAQTGATGLNNMIGKYTALGDDAKAIDLQKLYGNEIKNVGEGLDKLQGNIAMAQQMGLPLEAVLADDDYVKLALQKEINEEKINNALQRLQMNWDYRNALENQKHQWRLQTPRFSGGRSRGRSTQKTTMGAWNVYNDLVGERGIDPVTAANYVNSTFGSSIKPLQINSTNLYGGRTLHR